MACGGVAKNHFLIDDEDIWMSSRKSRKRPSPGIQAEGALCKFSRTNK